VELFTLARRAVAALYEREDRLTAFQTKNKFVIQKIKDLLNRDP
jgi:hypothetical protein